MAKLNEIAVISATPSRYALLNPCFRAFVPLKTAQSSEVIRKSGSVPVEGNSLGR